MSRELVDSLLSDAPYLNKYTPSKSYADDSLSSTFVDDVGRDVREIPTALLSGVMKGVKGFADIGAGLIDEVFKHPLSGAGKQIESQLRLQQRDYKSLSDLELKALDAYVTEQRSGKGLGLKRKLNQATQPLMQATNQMMQDSRLNSFGKMYFEAAGQLTTQLPAMSGIVSKLGAKAGLAVFNSLAGLSEGDLKSAAIGAAKGYLFGAVGKATENFGKLSRVATGAAADFSIGQVGRVFEGRDLGVDSEALIDVLTGVSFDYLGHSPKSESDVSFVVKKLHDDLKKVAPDVKKVSGFVAKGEEPEIARLQEVKGEKQVSVDDFKDVHGVFDENKWSKYWSEKREELDFTKKLAIELDKASEAEFSKGLSELSKDAKKQRKSEFSVISNEENAVFRKELSNLLSLIDEKVYSQQRLKIDNELRVKNRKANAEERKKQSEILEQNFNKEKAFLQNEVYKEFERIKLVDHAVEDVNNEPLLKRLARKALENDLKVTDSRSSLDNYFNNVDDAVFMNRNAGVNIQDELRSLVDQKKSPNSDEFLDEALQLYIDLPNFMKDADPEVRISELNKIKKKLSAHQVKLLEKALRIESPKTGEDLRLRQIASFARRKYGEAQDLRENNGIAKTAVENYTSRFWDNKKRKISHEAQRTYDSIIDGWLNGETLKHSRLSNTLTKYLDDVHGRIQRTAFIDRNLKLQHEDVDGEVLPLFTLSNSKRIGNFADLEVEQQKNVLSKDRYEVKGDEVVLNYNYKPTALKKMVAIGSLKENPQLLKKLGHRDFVVDDNGVLYEYKTVYAPEELARDINTVFEKHQFSSKTVQKVADLNAKMKSIVLTTSLYHHKAFLRSYYLGVGRKGRGNRGLVKAMNDGLQAAKKADPVLRLLMSRGMTLSINQEGFARSDKGHFSTKTKLGKLRQKQEDFLFGKLGAGLKAKAALIEFDHAWKRNLKQKNPRDIDDVAREVAELMNADFGGLNLKRMGISEKNWNYFKLGLLAPDWTLSNLSSVTRMFMGDSKSKLLGSRNKYEKQLYRKFWTRIAAKGAIYTTLINLGLVYAFGGDFDDYVKNMKKAWKAGHLRWMEVDITPMTEGLGFTSDKRKRYWKFAGHFIDPVKWATAVFQEDAALPLKHKASIVSRVVLDFLNKADWKGSPYTPFKTLVKDFKTTSFREEKKMSIDRWPSFIIEKIRSGAPIPLQEAMKLAEGEVEWFDALSKSLGFMTSKQYKKK